MRSQVLQMQFRKACKHLCLVELTKKVQSMSCNKLTPIPFFSLQNLKAHILLLSSLILDNPCILLYCHLVFSQKYVETLGIHLDNIRGECTGTLAWEARLLSRGAQTVVPGPAARTC